MLHERARRDVADGDAGGLLDEPCVEEIKDGILRRGPFSEPRFARYRFVDGRAGCGCSVRQSRRDGLSRSPDAAGHVADDLTG